MPHHIPHRTPVDFKKVLSSSSALETKWNDLTPLARNEWNCWVTSAKKDETRKRRIERVKDELMKGKRRPCCFAGCPHR